MYYKYFFQEHLSAFNRYSARYHIKICRALTSEIKLLIKLDLSQRQFLRKYSLKSSQNIKLLSYVHSLPCFAQPLHSSLAERCLLFTPPPPQRMQTYNYILIGITQFSLFYFTYLFIFFLSQIGPVEEKFFLINGA